MIYTMTGTETDLDLAKLRADLNVAEYELLDTSEDDHEICADVQVKVKDKTLQFDASWIIAEFLADIIYAQKGDASAKSEVADYIIESVLDVIDDDIKFDGIDGLSKSRAKMYKFLTKNYLRK